MTRDWNKDKQVITGEYYQAINLCNIELFNLLKQHQDKTKETYPLIEYVLERIEAAIVLTENNLLWDAEIVMRAALETLVKFAFISDAGEMERPQLLKEFWYDLSEIYTIKLSEQAKKNLSSTIGNEMHRLAHSPQILSPEDEVRLRGKWSKATRSQLEQKWSFTGIVATLTKRAGGELAHGIQLTTHSYRMASHITHGDEMGINLIRERKSRNDEDKLAVTISHYLRLMMDSFHFCFLMALYACKYLKSDPKYFIQLYQSLKQYDDIIKEYQIVPFEDELYDSYKKTKKE